MEQYNEKIGTRKDLVSYRIETAKSDLKSAKILLNAGEYKGANNRAPRFFHRRAVSDSSSMSTSGPPKPSASQPN